MFTSVINKYQFKAYLMSDSTDQTGRVIHPRFKLYKLLDDIRVYVCVCVLDIIYRGNTMIIRRYFLF